MEIIDLVWKDIAGKYSAFLYRQPDLFENAVEADWPFRERKKIYPVFLSFMGCKRRCIFCAQDVQTGFGGNLKTIKEQLSNCRQFLENSLKTGGKTFELAFYGGTFTALPWDVLNICLEFAQKLFENGYISGFRCSTRPETIDAKCLQMMKDAGCRLVELGIQTFDENALHSSGRQYSALDCEKAIKLVHEMGIQAGAQLMPGFPNTRDDQFIDDLARSIELNVKIFRFYPCLVFENTGLAFLYKQGKYFPLSLEKATALCACGWLMARKFHAGIIRMGVAAQDQLADKIIAGPVHFAFGNLVMAESLYRYVKYMLEISQFEGSQLKIFLPSHSRGYFNGWKKNLLDKWHLLGVTSENCFFWDKEEIRIEKC